MEDAMRRLALLLLTMLCVPLLTAGEAAAQQWVASWTASAHGPYPIGNPTAQPELKYAFASGEQGARDQTFRLIVKPDVWGPQTRIRLSNAFGTKPITFDGAFVGLQESGAAVVKGTSQPVLFGGQKNVTVQPGQSVASDAAAEGPQARGQLPRRGRERPDDLARQGSADLVRDAARFRLQGPGRERERFPLLNDLVVLPRRGRHESAGQGTGHRGLR
jgi:hypothetical protein